MLINSREGFEAARTVLIDADVIAVDTETNMTQDWETRRLIGIATYCKIKGREEFVSFYFPFRHVLGGLNFGNLNLPMDWLRELRVALSRPECTYLFHNAKFDLEILERDGIIVNGKIYDTMIMHHMIWEYPPHGLKPLGKQLFGEDASYEEKKIKQIEKDLGGWELIPVEVMDRYACKDVLLTYRLWEKLLPELKEQELDHLWEDEIDFSKCLMQIERLGIGIHRTRATHFAEQAEARLEELRKILGYDPMKPDQLASRLFGTPPEGLGFVPGSLSGSRTPMFPKGRPIMDRPTLSRYDHPEISLILEYRSLIKATSTWFRGFLLQLDTHDRLHPNYRQHGTVTTRLSCSKPNMQQLPRRKEEEEEEGVSNRQVKLMIKSMPEHQVWEFDYNQAEFRLATCYGKEEILYEAYRAGTDMHQITADKLGIPRAATDGTKREGKTLNFMILYGAGPKKLSETMNITHAEAASLRSEWWAAYPSLADAIDRATQAAEARSWVRLWTGRRRHFRFPSECSKAFNSVIQGGVAEIVKVSMIKFYRDFPELKMIAQVHDSLWFEIPEDQLDIIPEIKKVMEWPSKEFDLPFPVDTKRIDHGRFSLQTT